MENLIFSLNATIPIFILMVLGVLFRKVGLMDGPFVDRMNQFVFKAALPVLLFEDLANSDFPMSGIQDSCCSVLGLP